MVPPLRVAPVVFPFKRMLLVTVPPVMTSWELPPKVPVVRVPEDIVNVEVLSKVAAERVPPDRVWVVAVPALVVREATAPPDWLKTPAPAVVTAARVLPVSRLAGQKNYHSP